MPRCEKIGWAAYRRLGVPRACGGIIPEMQRHEHNVQPRHDQQFLAGASAPQLKTIHEISVPWEELRVPNRLIRSED